MKLAPYPEYKESGTESIGSVPSHWTTPHLGHVSACLDYLRVPLNASERADRLGDVPYWGANGVVGAVDRALVDGPLVLLGEDGAPFFDRYKDKAFFVDSPIWPNNHIHVLRPSGPISGRFLAHALNATDYAAWIEGSTRDKLTQGNMTSIPIPLPPRDEQDRIVDFLDRETAKIDALIAKQEQLIATLREDRTATIAHAVTKGLDPDIKMVESGVEWLGATPAHWSRQRFSTLYSESDDRLGDVSAPELLSVSIHLGVRPRRELITDKEARADDFTKYKLCRPGDIVLNRMRAFQGGLGVAGEAGIVSPDYMVMRILPTAVPDYLGYLMKTPWFVEQMTSRLRGIGGVDQGNARTPRINPRDLGGIEIMLPPVAEQLGIVEMLSSRLSKVDRLTEKADETVRVFREYRSALVTDAVTGKIDVRGVA